jgi:hypothetical protein
VNVEASSRASQVRELRKGNVAVTPPLMSI